MYTTFREQADQDYVSIEELPHSNQTLQKISIMELSTTLE